MFNYIRHALKKLGNVLYNAFLASREYAVRDDIFQTALLWVRVAANKAMDNAGKREFVVSILVARGVPESIARLAVELAVQALKKELERF